MAKYVQADRPLRVTTPLGPDVLLIEALNATEGISRLFSFELELIAENDKNIAFDALLGKKITVALDSPISDSRYFSGICSSVSQGERDMIFTTYRMDVVPEFWLLTRRSQSRIFQQMTVPDILKKVLQGLKFTPKLEKQYEPRDYCVQYRETDFDFASRLMEEEGIFYFFTHSKGDHTLILADSPSAFPPMPISNKVKYGHVNDKFAEEDRVDSWVKRQLVRSGKVTLRDHHFEKPHDHFESQKSLTDSVTAGTVSHKIKIGESEKLEQYDWPGLYAQRFDGVDPGGGDRPADIGKIPPDGKRTVDLRIEAEASTALVISAKSQLRQMTPGHRFSLSEHFNADGEYIVTDAQHSANLRSSYRSGGSTEDFYRNNFNCIPSGLPFRPQRTTHRPVVPGTQTAVVVGPPGEEIFTDKYGRVKVQFHWDREGKNDQKSSCWIRVAQPTAGRRWGSSFWPRVGQEVIVAFEEGDPDRPIIVGTVYNPDQMPPYLGKGPDGKHPEDNKVSGMKSNSTRGGDGFNEWRFDDTKDKEQIFLHAERDMDTRVKHDSRTLVQHNEFHIVGTNESKEKAGDLHEEIFRDHHEHIHRDLVQHIEGCVQLLVGKGEVAQGGDVHVDIEKNRIERLGSAQHTTIGSDRHTKVDGSDLSSVGRDFHTKAGMTIVLEAGQSLTIKGPGGFISIDASGVTIEGTMVKINCGGSPATAKSASPRTPDEAKPAKPQVADDAKSGQKSN